MCGITGVVLRDAAPVDEAALRMMTEAIAHRGPDGDGHWFAPGVGFGHRRLKIVDLSAAAAQPMRALDAGATLTFNGEVYNFVALRKELEALGDRFVSTGDTEVLLRALLRWGTSALARTEGMLSLGFWREDRRELILARDRFGKKPLYYAPFGRDGIDGLAFASELRALLAWPRVRAERAVDPSAVIQYLGHEFVPAPRTILSNVRKLRAGEVLRWRDGEPLRCDRWFTPRHHRESRGSDTELAGELSRLVEQATRDRLVADVPVGIFLSGGLDSSFIAACATQTHPRVRTFSIGFDDASFDESAHARTVARHLGTEHVEERLSTHALLDVVPSTLDWIDEPFADSSLLPTTLLARIARRDVVVALGGDGGDETLAGYPTFTVDRAMRWVPAFSRSFAHIAQRAAARVPPSDGYFSLGFKARQFAQGLADRGARRHARWLAPLVPEAIAPMLHAAEMRNALANVFEAVDATSAGLSNDFDAATAFYLGVYLADGVLTKVDRATMRSSLEARAPLLDSRVVDFCLGLDPSVRLRGRTTKWLMRKALARRLPEAIVARPKQGFGAPVGAWLRGPLRDLLRDTLSPARIATGGWFRPQAVDAMIDAHESGRQDLRKPLWALLVLEHWRVRWFA